MYPKRYPAAFSIITFLKENHADFGREKADWMLEYRIRLLEEIWKDIYHG
ncbi:hypothetical protein [Luxibacter massiliensis]|nr:hypothetical protein [Luxibacter massiliensis]